MTIPDSYQDLKDAEDVKDDPDEAKEEAAAGNGVGETVAAEPTAPDDDDDEFGEDYDEDDSDEEDQAFTSDEEQVSPQTPVLMASLLEVGKSSGTVWPHIYHLQPIQGHQAPHFL